MVSFQVKGGRVGASRSIADGLVLLQVDDDESQARAVMTIAEARRVISEIERAIAEAEKCRAKDETREA